MRIRTVEQKAEHARKMVVRYALNKERLDAQQKEYYYQNREAILAKRTEHYRLNRESIREKLNRVRRLFDLIKMERPCYDCGEVLDPQCMDWDHINPADKTEDVARMINSRSIAEVMDEINKCQLVCACCHRLREKSRRSLPEP